MDPVCTCETRPALIVSNLFQPRSYASRPLPNMSTKLVGTGSGGWANDMPNPVDGVAHVRIHQMDASLRGSMLLT